MITPADGSDLLGVIVAPSAKVAAEVIHLALCEDEACPIREDGEHAHVEVSGCERDPDFPDHPFYLVPLSGFSEEVVVSINERRPAILFDHYPLARQKD